MVNATSSGLACDGNTDDTKALAILIDKLASQGGGTISFPARTRTVVKTVRVKSGVSLSGEDASAALVTHGMRNAWITVPNNTRDVTISNLRLEWANGVAGRFVSIESGSGITVEKCEFISAGGAGDRAISVADGKDIAIVACSVNGFTNGIQVAGNTGKLRIEACSFAGWERRCIQILGTATASASGVMILNNHIEMNTGNEPVRQPIQFQGNNMSPFVDVRVAGNVVRGRDTSYWDTVNPGTADQISLHFCRNFTVEDNVVLNGGEVGITIARQCYDGVVRRNTVTGNDSAGIVIGSGASVEVGGIEVSDNVLENNGVDRINKGRKDWTKAGVVLYNATDIKVLDNRFVNPNGGNQEFAVTSTNSRDIQVKGSKMTGPIRQELLDRASTQGEQGP